MKWHEKEELNVHNEYGEIVGSVTPKDIIILFKDVIGDKDLISEEMYEEIIKMCVKNEWSLWESSFKEWKSEGILN